MRVSFQPTMGSPATTRVTRAVRTVEPWGGRAGAKSGGIDRRLANILQRIVAPAGVRVELWDGHAPLSAPQNPLGSMVVGDRRTILGLIVNPDIAFGEAYMAGRLQIRGPFEPVLEALSRLSLPSGSWRERLASAMAVPNTLNGARRNVHHHYDLGNDFYALWLDRELVYTCAFFDRPDVGLEAAQRAKLDRVCQKLQLQPGETVVEAGCGWGALALHMARHYGVRVTAFNVSNEQLQYARARAEREHLTDLVTFINDDYRNVRGRFDAFVSVGMLEHVGLAHFHSLATVLHDTVKRDGGRGLLHFIGRDTPRPLNAWIRRRIFPGAYPPTLAEVSTRVLAPAEMSVVDVENLRLHYAQTLAHWSERFAAVKDQVSLTYGDAFQRAWELYLAGSQAAFATGWVQLFQVVFAPREGAPPFWTRDVIPHTSRAIDDPL
ncbi:MAG: class I SAM-dependent methyltransferase [Acidobacteria bacterium]|nr:class I SAM-dependent methyltransferase [Acidobacteriota bacterium]